MAGKSAKKHAINNTRILNQSIYISSGLITLSLSRLFLSNDKSVTLSFFFNLKLILSQLPLLVCLYILNKTGRPIWSNGELKNEGSMINLSNPQGLVEYMLDIIYLSWVGDIFLTIFNSFKLIWLIWIIVIPSYIIYKLFQLRNQFGGSKSFNIPQQNNKNARSRRSINAKETEKSKRQLKRENRSNEKVKYRYK
ncbi:Snd2p PWA37_000052 [Arxiozyma heterogenica]|uniref:DUF788-domain-containing protein n=1 Tax=Arxiozyma heterogenica TaxID=278026 RepID=A0AAN7WKB6_9SACH|nr:hypothetical protein RI543_004346 [Kazachstania heterogenica]